MSEKAEKILENISKAINSAPDKEQYFLGLAEGMAMMAAEASNPAHKAEKEGKR